MGFIYAIVSVSFLVLISTKYMTPLSWSNLKKNNALTYLYSCGLEFLLISWSDWQPYGQKGFDLLIQPQKSSSQGSKDGKLSNKPDQAGLIHYIISVILIGCSD